MDPGFSRRQPKPGGALEKKLPLKEEGKGEGSAVKRSYSRSSMELKGHASLGRVGDAKSVSFRAGCAGKVHRMRLDDSTGGGRHC